MIDSAYAATNSFSSLSNGLTAWPDGVDVETLCDTEPMLFPSHATANDVREIVKYLGKRETGSPLSEAVTAEPRRIFELRKIAAYSSFGIIQNDNERLILSDLGKYFFEKVSQEKSAYRLILKMFTPYLEALQWIRAENTSVVTHRDLAEYWASSSALKDSGRKQDEAVAISFFSICHGAEIGIATVGKRGQPSRLRVDQSELYSFLKQTDSPESVTETRELTVPETAKHPVNGGRHKVYLSFPASSDSGAVLCRFLELAGFDYLDGGRRSTNHALIPLADIRLMQQCEAAVFIIDSGEKIAESPFGAGISNRTLTEINIASALYKSRVIVCWCGKSSPSKILLDSGLHIETHDQFTWETGMKIVSILKDVGA